MTFCVHISTVATGKQNTTHKGVYLNKSFGTHLHLVTLARVLAGIPSANVVDELWGEREVV
jgi:hypothetical protein